MIRRRTLAGLALLCGLLFLSAFATQSAWAAKAVNTTATTCVAAAGNGDFNDAHCDSPNAEKNGNFTHETIPLNTTTEIDAVNKEVTEETKKSEPGILKSKIGLTKTEISCSTVKGNTGKSTLHNVESEGKHTFTGSAVAEFSECIVLQPSKCTIKEPIVSEGTFEGVEGLGAGGNEMGVEYRGAGAEESFTTITYEGSECPLKSKSFKVKGSAIGTSGPTTESSQTNKFAGATIVLTPKNSMQSLKLGIETAEFTLIVVPRMAGGGGNPISITTTT